MENNKAEVDEALFNVLSMFSNAAGQLGVPWLVIGATARVMLLEKVYGLPAGLATQDVDFAVQVGDWEHYQKLREIILSNESIEAGRPSIHRFKIEEGMIFDLLPYGGVEDDVKQISWPPDGDVIMSVRGFAGANEYAVHVEVNEKISVPVVSPQGLLALKLFSWKDRHTEHPGRDAKDIGYIFHHIESLYPADMLFDKHESSVEAADYVIPLAGVFQLGKDIAVMLQEEEKQFLSTLFGEERVKQEDSVLCRELKKYANMSSIDETMKMLDFLNKGLCSMLNTC